MLGFIFIIIVSHTMVHCMTLKMLEFISHTMVHCMTLKMLGFISHTMVTLYDF